MGACITIIVMDLSVPSMYCIAMQSTKSVNPSPALMLSIILGVAAAIMDISSTAPSYGVTVAVALCAPLREKIRLILVTEQTCYSRIGRYMPAPMPPMVSEPASPAVALVNRFLIVIAF